MTTETAVATTENGKELALLRAVGLDRVSPDQRNLAINIAERYELDLLLKHLVMVDGRPYITRDGLLHVAHRSGQLDGIETTEAAIVDGFWRASCSVYRKDMSRPFTYTGRYPTTGGNQKFAPEMAVKVAEVMALRRAFDVAAPVAEERWDVEQVPSASAEKPSLAERAAQARAAIVVDPTPQEAASEAPVAAHVAEDEAGMSSEAQAEAVESPGETASAPIGRLALFAAIKDLGLPETAVVERAGALYPGIKPKDMTDEQRGEVLASLRVTPPTTALGL